MHSGLSGHNSDLQENTIGYLPLTPRENIKWKIVSTEKISLFIFFSSFVSEWCPFSNSLQASGTTEKKHRPTAYGHFGREFHYHLGTATQSLFPFTPNRKTILEIITHSIILWSRARYSDFVDYGPYRISTGKYYFIFNRHASTHTKD